jgi:integrase
MIDSGLCRQLVNKRVNRVRHVVKWAVAEELVSASVLHGLQAVAGLQRGRTAARESEKVRPVDEETVNRTLLHLSPTVRAMVELQRLTGCRPAEVCQMRACDFDITGSVWTYRPVQHKTAWRGGERVIAIGPRAQAVLKPFFALDTHAYLFSPKRAMAERAAELRKARKSRVQPSQICRRKKRPRRAPSDRYRTSSYGRAVRRACRAAGVPTWSPNRIRHSFASLVRKKYGLEHAQVALGHAQADVTQIYAERDLSLATKLAAKIG